MPRGSGGHHLTRPLTGGQPPLTGDPTVVQVAVMRYCSSEVVSTRLGIRARSRQKSYADKRRKPLEFKVGDRVLLKVSPWNGVVRFGKKGKLAPRYVGPFEIMERVGPVAYRLKLPQELSCVHDTFHVSNLKKCLADPDVQVPLDEIEIDKICDLYSLNEIVRAGCEELPAKKNPIGQSSLELSARS
ncbi:hypothetical protein Tco_1266386 [Tanacetum coccineum]